jgi:hypothetical protein
MKNKFILAAVLALATTIFSCTPTELAQTATEQATGDENTNSEANPG